VCWETCDSREADFLLFRKNHGMNGLQRLPESAGVQCNLEEPFGVEFREDVSESIRHSVGLCGLVLWGGCGSLSCGIL
jgi:hypothetical protein